MSTAWLVARGLALAAVASACSSDPSAFDDGGVPDGGGGLDGGDGDPDGATDDAPGPDAGHDDVVVHVRRGAADGGPDPGATVIHAAADGTVRAMTTTDAAGTARFVVTAGDSITVGLSGLPHLTTIAGVEPGDDLWFGPPPLAAIGSMTVTVPAHASATGYELRGPCLHTAASDTPQLAVTLRAGCPATRTVLAVALGAGAGGGDLAFAAQLATANGGAVTLGGTYAAPVAMSATIVGVAADTGASYTFAPVMGGHVTFPQMLAHDPATNVVTWQHPPGLTEGIYLSVDAPDGTGTFAATRPVAPGATTIDLTRRVATITDITFDPDVAWTVSSEGTIDGLLVASAMGDGKGQPLVSWDFILPADARTVTRPQLAGLPDTRVEQITVVDVAGASYRELRADAVITSPLAHLFPAMLRDTQSWSAAVD